MPANKPRLYVGLYARGTLATLPGGEYKYHWSILIGPKTDREDRQGIRYHVKQVMKAGKTNWILEEDETTMTLGNFLLVRVVVGKVEQFNELVSILRCTPIRQDEIGWTSVDWVEAVIRSIAGKKVLGTGLTRWKSVRRGALWYCAQKENEHWFDGKGNLEGRRTLTYNLFEMEETIS